MLRLVEGGDGGDVVAAGAGEFFLGDQIFEDTTDGLGAAFAGDLGGFCRGVEGGAERGELRGERLGAGVKLDDLAANGVAGLFEFEFAPTEPGFAAADAAAVEEATGTDAPAEADAVVVGGVETAGPTAETGVAAEAAEVGLRAHDGNERRVARAVVLFADGGEAGVGLGKFGASGEGASDEGGEVRGRGGWGRRRIKFGC